MKLQDTMNIEESAVESTTAQPSEISEATAATNSGDVITNPQNDQNVNLTQNLSYKYQKILKKQQLMYERALQKMMLKQKREQQYTQTRINEYKRCLGNEFVQNLIEKNTVKTPEVLDESGNVKQAAKTEIKYKEIFKECALEIVKRREARILNGQRKRSTGRSSDRKKHKNTLNFIQVGLVLQEISSKE